ncbi:hypothetical protein CLI92_05640 [Vandammella animalimorsus]|uniref:Uncharacterized protein n=1 Tax=Vandammella animalimorsus TaxID=2029117 RepID=A0A2A2T606_9BURK|nr:hypothetical protein [Vandammella animalimorsus]PAX17029.1 hypothetical protein CLI92_05640 [Vandammella animalimorsus]PAX19002.1 hypothetical protein CLI93_09570 [Vandammella animalimorsus]
MSLEEDPAPTPASKALKAWYATLVQAMHSGVPSDQGVFIQPMPPLAASARASDFLAAQWTVDEDAGRTEAQERDNWCGWAFFSPRGQAHCALLFTGTTVGWGGGAMVWVDGEPVPVPRFATGGSRLEDTGEWLNERWFAVRLGGFYEHPHARICISAHGLGNIFGYWIYDAQTRTARSIAPGDEDAWETPKAEVVGNDLAIYASPEDQVAGRVARWVPL